MLLDRPEERIAVVAHGAPVRYLLLALEGKPPVAVLDGVERAKPFPVDGDRRRPGSRSARSVGRGARLVGHTEAMLQRIESFIREQDLIEPGGEVTCLVSGGADSTCLWHALGALGYRVSALHVAHGLRGAESDEDARFCREAFGAEVVACVSETQSPAEAELRELRYSVAADRLRATGHTASDQVESVLLGLVASGTPQRIKAKREDGVVRPLLGLWREETRAYCEEHGLGLPRGLVQPGRPSAA